MRARILKLTLLGIAAIGTTSGFVLWPDQINVPGAAADGPPDTVRLYGKVNDFRRAHPDFDVVPDTGYGHVAGSVGLWLGPDGRPAYVPPAEIVDDFDINDRQLTPNDPFAVELVVLGSAIYSGQYHRPVTMRVMIGDDAFEPFGPYTSPVSGSLNDDQSATGWANPGSNPRVVALSDTFSAGSTVSVIGKSWKKVHNTYSGLQDSHWETKLVASTADDDDDDEAQMLVLRDGDPVPSVGGAFDQASVTEYVAPYIDFATNTMDLGDHQAIYCFELALPGSHNSADFQDLVVLVSLASDPSFFEEVSYGSGGAVRRTGGYEVDDEWRDGASRPIAPHLYRDGTPGVKLASAPTTGSGHPVFDTFDADLGPYGGTNVGPAPLFVTGAPMPPIHLPPDLGPSQGDLDYDNAGVVVVNDDIHCDKLVVKTHTELHVTNHVTILCDDDFKLENQADIRIMGNASLTLYVNDNVEFRDQVEANVNTADPSRFRIYNLGSKEIKVEDGAHVYAQVVSPNSRLRIKNSAHFYGHFIGQTVHIEDTGTGFHADTADRSICGAFLDDTAGLVGSLSDAGVQSPDTFGEWYRDVLGTNLSGRHGITLVNDGTGVYQYLDEAFFPIDDQLLGNEGQSHNYFFTYTIAARCTYEACAGQFLEFQGGDGAWLYVDDQLALDLGGVSHGTTQRADLDRLGLTDGQSYTLRFFFAQRDPASSVFRLRTNIQFPSDQVATVSTGGFD